MSILNSVKRSSVFNEFTPEEQDKWFSIKAQKTLHHIDTLYYSINLKEERVFDGQLEAPEILRLLKELSDLKQEKNEHIDREVEFRGLQFSLKHFSIYSYCLTEPDMYDIFISEYVPNSDTPRIVVQLRTAALIMKGTQEAISESFMKIKSILDEFGLVIVDVNENRIDYAWHTNLIQNPNFFMSDQYLSKHLKSNMRNGMKHFDPQNFVYNYIAVGTRKSNNVFARIYDKTKEVIEEAYKAFFLERWRQNGLISEYDYYCLSYAYKCRSYTVGVLVGRCRWYLEYGKNEDRKNFIRYVLKKYDINSSNSKYIRKEIDGRKRRISCEDFFNECCAARYQDDDGERFDADREYDPSDDKHIAEAEKCSVTLDCLLPPTTVILNFEYQTKRHFYRSLDKMIAGISAESEIPYFCRIYTILRLEKQICDYLTGVGSTMSFVRDRNNIDRKLLKEHPEEVYTDFWWRLRNTKISGSEDVTLLRQYSRHSDIERYRRKIIGNIAALSMLLNKSTDVKTSYTENVTDVLCYLNDNDMKADMLMVSGTTGEQYVFENKEYADLHKRKARMMKNRVVEK